MTPAEKPSGTSAATTAFCAAKLEGPGGHTLWFDGNGKITAGNGTLDAPKPNAFSLAHIDDCPGSTESCRAACYVHGLAKHAPETYALYRHNSATIRKILGSDISVVLEWINGVAEWINQHCQGGFRWHVSGDVFSAAYGNWITEICQRSHHVRHWIYTRSFDLVHTLVPASVQYGGNLVINISCDQDNYKLAESTADKYGLRLCHMTRDGSLPLEPVEGDVIFPDYNLRGGTSDGQEWFAALPPQIKKMVCPVDMWEKSENRRCGPCNRCLI